MLFDNTKIQTLLEEIFQYPNPTYFRVCLENWNKIGWNTLGIDTGDKEIVKGLTSLPLFVESGAMEIVIDSDKTTSLYAKVNHHDCKNLLVTKDTKLQFSGKYNRSFPDGSLKPIPLNESHSRLYIYPRFFPSIIGIFIAVLIEWSSILQLFKATFKYIRVGE